MTRPARAVGEQVGLLHLDAPGREYVGTVIEVRGVRVRVRWVDGSTQRVRWFGRRGQIIREAGDSAWRRDLRWRLA